MTTTDHKPDLLDGLDPLMSVRPRLRHDVLFSDTGDGVVFRKSGGGYVMKGRTAYRFTASLAPFLTGGLTVGELCAELAPERQRMIVDFVRNLIDRGYARDVRSTEQAPIDGAVRERFAAQINYVEHYVDDAVARFLRFRTSRILVLGTGPTATAAAYGLLTNGLATVRMMPASHSDEVPAGLLAEAAQLTAAGCAARVELVPSAPAPAELADYDVVIAPADDVSVATLSRLGPATGTGPVVLPAAVVGGEVLVGPLVRPMAAPCWTCAVLRLAANADPGQVAALWKDIGRPDLASPRRLRGPLAAMIGNLLGYEIFRLTTGSLAPETADGVVVQDIATLEVRRERLLAHPSCPSCRQFQNTGDVSTVTVPTMEDEDPDPDAASDGGPRATDQVLLNTILVEIETLVGAHVGVVREFEDLSLDQSPLKVSRVRLGSPDGQPTRLITAFDLHHLPMARRRAMRAAMLVYTGQVADIRTAVDDGDGTVAPAELVTASGLPAGEPVAGSWLPARSLVTGRRLLVPAAAVYPFSSLNDGGLFELTSAGDGAGSTPAEAAAAGLRSALAYDALYRAARGDVGRAVAVGAQVPGSELEFLMRTLDTLAVNVDLIELAAGRPYHVVLARQTATTGPPLWTVGAAASGRRAAIEALRDLVGIVQLRRALGPDTEVDLGSPLLAGLDARAVRVDGRPEQIGPSVLRGIGVPAGFDALVVDTTTPDLSAHGGIVTARVLLRRPA